jgi:adenylate cyclase
VFVLNRYFDVMAQIVRRHGGEVDKFLGDGIMALFGVAPAAGAGSRDALFAARDMLAALETLNEEFADSLGHRLRMGIGIHSGPAILGRVGAERSMGLTALGDSVNIASRLEALNKEFGTVVVVSQSALAAAHLMIDGAEEHDVPVRGRAEGLRIIVAHSLEGLREAGEPGPAHPAETASPVPSAPPA